MWGGARGGLSGIWVCVCVCVSMSVFVWWGRGGWGLKWERKGDSDRLKKKWRKGGGDWPGAVSPIFFLFFFFFWQNLIIPLWKIYFYHKSLRINCAQLMEMAILLVEVRVFIAVTNSASQFCPFQWDLPSAAKHTQALLCSCGWRQPSLSNSLLV